MKLTFDLDDKIEIKGGTYVRFLSAEKLRKNSHKEWSKLDDEKLIKMKEAGDDSSVIAKVLDRTVSGVNTRYSQLTKKKGGR